MRFKVGVDKERLDSIAQVIAECDGKAAQVYYSFRQ